jgi:serine/threonine protein kinase/tetratricopeptide (TPR) repeat protein
MLPTPMTPERWQQVKAALVVALELTPPDRAAYLDQACAGDQPLRDELDRLLMADQLAGAAFLESPAMPPDLGERAQQAPDLWIGRRVGAYEIVAPLGAGGMGEVYRARDTRLKRDVAIKVLPETFATDPDRLARFQREAEVLATLNHPNIAAVYGLEESGHTTAIVLELVEGETLAARLAHGALPIADALSIARQIVDALDAAQEQGIVHRDLKPANINITPRGVVKVLDFGLAKAIVAVGSSPELKHSPAITETSGVVLGTAAYMSPEQARGKPVDTQTDIWAFGCVLYEMLTGQSAFAGNTAIDTIAAILDREPNWNALPSSLPASAGRLIRHCLEKERDQRVANIAELRAGLNQITADTAPLSERPNDRRPYAAAGAAVLTGAVLVGLLMSAGVRGWRARSSQTSASRNPPQAVNLAQTKARRAVAVMGFKNLSGRKESAWLSPALSETLTMELGTGGTLRAIPGESIARMKIDLAFADVDTFAQDTLPRIRRNIGADVLILGSYLTVGKQGEGQIRLDVRLQDAATGDIVATVTETGREPELLELVSRTGGRLREKLGVGALSEEESAQARASLPSNDVVRFYSEGLDKLRLFDALAARDLLERAVTADPGYALAHSGLASAWSALGYDASATAEAKKALDLTAKLSREQRLAIEGSYREIAHQWNDAAKIYRALWTVFPDNAEYGLRLAEVFVAGGMGKDALGVVEQLRLLPAPAKDDPRIDLAEGDAAGSLSDFKRQQSAAERAATKGQAQGARLLLARARLIESRALYELGELPQTVAASQEAKDIYTAAGDRAGAAAALNTIASVIAFRGDVVQATEMHQQAVEIFRQIGNKKGMASALNNIAVQLKDNGDLTGARKAQEQVLALRREVADKSGAATSLNNIGVIFFEQGNLASAKRMYGDSLSICREIGDKRGAVRAMLNMAIVLTREGDLAGAKRLHEESLAIRREIGDRRGVAVALINVAEILFIQGDLAGATSAVDESMAIGLETDSKRTQAYALFTRGQILEAEGHLVEARKAHLDALAIRERLRETLTTVESRISLAALAVEEDKAAEAETGARSAAEESQRSKQADDESMARAVLARALLAQNKLDEARKAVAQSSALLGKSEDLEARLELRITEGRVAAASGQTAAAAKTLEATRQQAARAGLVGVELEARLALGELEVRSARGAAGRARLELLQKAASTRGFGLIARHAAAAISRSP